MNASWHPACFRCNMCGKELADLGFIKHGNQALCHDCNARIRLQGTGRYMCHKCQYVPADEGVVCHLCVRGGGRVGLLVEEKIRENVAISYCRCC